MALAGDDRLERSAVVANCRMNRERGLVGPNGYDRELGFNPLDFLTSRHSPDASPAWLDLCCGSGRALIEACERLRAEGRGATIVGVDLAGEFRPTRADDGPALIEASLSSWQPGRMFDLITCVHGLHYIGDKLGLIARIATWLAPEGLFVASLDLRNLVLEPSPCPARRSAAAVRRAGLEFDTRRRLLTLKGPRRLDFPFDYLGADDSAGPNYTGQPAVSSHYTSRA